MGWCETVTNSMPKAQWLIAHFLINVLKVVYVLRAFRHTLYTKWWIHFGIGGLYPFEKNTLIFVWIWMWCKYCCLRIDRLYILCVKLCILITKTNRCLISVHRMCTTYYVTGTFPVSSYSGITCERVMLMWLIQMQRTPVVDSRKTSLVTYYHPPISRRLLSTADWSHHSRIKYFKQKDTCSWQQQTTRNALKTTLYINKKVNV